MKLKQDIANTKLVAKELARQLGNRPTSTRYEVRLGFALAPINKCDTKAAQKFIKKFVKALGAFSDDALVGEVVLSVTQDTKDFNAKLVQDTQVAVLDSLKEDAPSEIPQKAS